MSEVISDPAELAGFILAGGASRRFGSDKAVATVAGTPLILHVAAPLGHVTRRVSVIADVADKHRALGLVTHEDLEPGLGPIGGLATILHLGLSPGWFILAPCDLFGLSVAWLEPLVRGTQQYPLASALAYVDSRWQPLPAAYHPRIAPYVHLQLAQGDRALWRLLAMAEAVALTPPVGVEPPRRVTHQGDLPGLAGATLGERDR